jgi:regulatory protein
MIIEKIEKTGRYRYRIWADGTQLISVSSAQLASLGISEGDELEGGKAEAFWNGARHLAAQTAMDLLLRRDFAEQELFIRLRRKGFSEELAAYGLSYVKSYHYTDDMRYARQLIGRLSGTCSCRMLRIKLQEKGLASDTISSALSSSGWDDRDGIRREIRRKFGENTDILNSDKDRCTKLIQSLQRKGYHYGDIREVLRETLTAE